MNEVLRNAPGSPGQNAGEQVARGLEFHQRWGFLILARGSVARASM